MLLAIDTSAGTAVALVSDDGRMLSERSTPDTRRHAEVIGPFLAEVFAEARATPAEVSDVTVGIGPGPFTGLRVGIAAARTFALARSVPLLPVPSHDAVALALVESGSAAGRFAVVTDARRREVAVSEYSAGLPMPTVVRAAFLALRLGWVHDEGVEVHEVHEIPAVSLARVALVRRAAGAPLPGPEPLYLRAPDVTLSSPKRVSA